MDLGLWPGPYGNAEMEDITHLFKSVALAYEQAGKQIVRTLTGAIKVMKITQQDLVLHPSTHASPPAVDIDVTGVRLMASDLSSVREQLVKTLVEDFDSTPELAEAAVLKVDQEHLDEYPDFDDLAEFVYGHEPFWDES